MMFLRILKVPQLGVVYGGIFESIFRGCMWTIQTIYYDLYRKVYLTYLQSELLINAPLKLNIEGVSG